MDIPLDDEWIEWMPRSRIDKMDPSSVRIIQSNVHGVIDGFMVITRDGRHDFKKCPALDDHVLHRVPQRTRGAIVARKRYKDADIFLYEFGHVDRSLVGRLLRLCVEEDTLLSRHYAARGAQDDVLLHVSDGLCFETSIGFLVHCLETTNIDILEELRHRPRNRFPISTDVIQKMHALNVIAPRDSRICPSCE